jgi:hypothetical protein
MLAGGAILSSLPGCSSGSRSRSDDDVVSEMTSPSRQPPLEPAVLHELVRHAIMAASSRNTQPWKFALADQSITVLPDLSRRTPIVDPDDLRQP